MHPAPTPGLGSFPDIYPTPELEEHTGENKTRESGLDESEKDRKEQGGPGNTHSGGNGNTPTRENGIPFSHNQVLSNGQNKRKRIDKNGDAMSGNIEGWEMDTEPGEQCPGEKRAKADPEAHWAARRQVLQMDGAGTSSTSDGACHGLTSSMWQKVFCFVPPVFLGRLMRVNRNFYDLLNPSQLSQADAVDPNQLHAELIWKASRKRFAPGLPKALEGQSELDMWRLLRGNGCQVCGARRPLLTTSQLTNSWESSPEGQYARVIWPFEVRCCNVCLRANSEQEMTLLLSSAFPSFLLPALPYAFITHSHDYIPSSAIRNDQRPANVQISKIYYKPHVEDLSRRFDAVKELGPGSAEEWIKGLESEGIEKSQCISKWELWESKGGLKKINTRPNQKGASAIKLVPIKIRHLSEMITPQYTSLNDDSVNVSAQSIMATTGPVLPHYTPAFQSCAGENFSMTTKYSLPQRPVLQIPHYRPERSIRDVNEAKAMRKVEIERRCIDLDPHLTPNVLCHLESFQAALQIATPLTEKAWDILRPRLLAQRQIGADKENENFQLARALESKTEELGTQEAAFRENKDSGEQEWEALQTPLRECLLQYADEVINYKWSSGKAVFRDSCPQFAADVLLYARRRFYETWSRSTTIVQDNLKQSDTGPPCRHSDEFLILEHMKWIFDNKIKPITDNFQRELFLCNGCDGNSKFYGFEAVIQHYAAKHTSSLSQGSVVVHWRAEWPDPPPFNPHPSVTKTSSYALPTPAMNQKQQAYKPNFAATANADAGHQFTRAPSSQNLSPTVAGPPMGNAHCGYHVRVQGKLQHESALGHYQSTSNGFVTPHSLPATSTKNYYAGLPSTAFCPQEFLQQSPGSGFFAPHHSIPASGPAPNAASHTLLRVPGGFPNAQLYHTQMIEMAKQARDVWFGTSGIKDIPQSVRIYVVIKHVVSRFEEKYTNELGLAMFIDGLDHIASMRPVRSLNGLACKTCVAVQNTNFQSTVAHSSQAPSVRKLYTLPHLLNHFKLAHLERALAVIKSQNGVEPARLDWKKDMIELPESSLIAELINAAGMTDSKLGLISSVFPGVFSQPLPSMDPERSTGLVPSTSLGSLSPSYQFHEQNLSPNQTPFIHSGLGPHQTDFLRTPQHMSTIDTYLPGHRDSEPPGEDEYDPHRPAHLGMIVEPHIISHPPKKARETRATDYGDYHTSIVDSTANLRALGSITNPTSLLHTQIVNEDPVLNRYRYYPELILQRQHGVSSTHENTNRKPSGQVPPKSEFEAADKFLSQIDPALGMESNTRPRYRNEPEHNQLLPQHAANEIGPALKASMLAGGEQATLVPIHGQYADNDNAGFNIREDHSTLMADDKSSQQNRSSTQVSFHDKYHAPLRVQHIYADDGSPVEKHYTRAKENSSLNQIYYPATPGINAVDDRDFEGGQWAKVQRAGSRSPQSSTHEKEHLRIRTLLDYTYPERTYIVPFPSSPMDFPAAAPVQYTYAPRQGYEIPAAQNVNYREIYTEHTRAPGQYHVAHEPIGRRSSGPEHVKHAYGLERVYKEGERPCPARYHTFDRRDMSEFEPGYGANRPYR